MILNSSLRTVQSNAHAVRSRWQIRRLASAASRVSISPLNRDVLLDYDSRITNLERIKSGSRKPLTLTEKILFSHLFDSSGSRWNINDIRRGETLLHLRPDRVACHDATATMALLQFISAGLPKVKIPTTVHSDHLIVSRYGAEEDLKQGLIQHQEVYKFLSSAGKKYGIGWWKPGAGIIHITIFENYAFPGGLIIGTDSHTPNAGGLGMLGIGVGGSDAVDAMAGMPWEILCPKVVGVRLTGKLHGWASAKDIICKLAGITTVAGGKGKVFEFFGPGTETLGATAMATICNMSAEIGSTSCIFPYTDAMNRYLTATRRSSIAQLANGYRDVLLQADEGAQYDEIIEIDLDTLEPHINGPFTPDLSHPLSQLKSAVDKSDWPVEVSHAMVGSCTNSSYEDLYKTQQLVMQAKAAGIDKFTAPFMVAPGSEDIRATAEAEGILQTLRDAGAVVLSTTCGPCVGQWDRTDVDVKARERNTVVSSFNRNFVGRHDGNPETCSFVTSPELVTAFAYAGRIDFDPATDALPLSNSQEEFRFSPPKSVELPTSFTIGKDLYQPPQEDAEQQLEVDIDPKSDRLQLLQPFKAWRTNSATNMPILAKIRGKCTTDHISPAGLWYKYRGHLENISHNMLLAASNAFLPSTSESLGHTIHPVNGKTDLIHEVARDLQGQGISWCIIGDWNYGEGSSREHAALEPRFLGGVAIIARSFARIHETNLKKQGMLPLTFTEPEYYDRIQQGDQITLSGVEDGELQPSSTVDMLVQTSRGDTWECKLRHTYSEGQLRWLRAGSALNAMRAASVEGAR